MRFFLFVGQMRQLLLLTCLMLTVVAGRRCSMMVAPALRVTPAGAGGTPAGAVYQETMSSSMSRINAFLDSENVTFTSSYQQWLQVAAADVLNSTVLSGWVESLNRFGMCSVGGGSSRAGGIFPASTDFKYIGEHHWCDHDPNVIGMYLQTISKQWVCAVTYDVIASCNWSPAYEFDAIKWELRQNYVPSPPAPPEPETSKATRARATSSLLFVVATGFFFNL